MGLFGKLGAQAPTVPGGLPGVARTEPELGPELLTTATAARAIGQAEVDKALETLRRYKAGKANLERRIIEDEQWYKLRHWEYIRKSTGGDTPEPASAWLFNSLTNKHADAMDNYPEPNVLPREPGDEEDAKVLSSVLPVVLERNGFEDTYSDNWWKKLKDGTSAYGVFWDKGLENGLGDIAIQPLDLLNLFWEPGVRKLQQSRNLFLVNPVDRDLLEAEYPQLRGKLGGDGLDVAKYIYDDAVDTTDKILVVDWYYKVKAADGRTLLHYAKIAGGQLLFASENEQEYTERGWYDHGEYPVVFDTLYPEEGSPCGFGLIAVAKNPQLYIDKLSANILQSSMMATKPRYFISANSGINRQQFMDWNEPLIEVAGSLDENRLRPVEVGSMSSMAVNVLQMKIDELKETTSNRDVSQGSTGGGVTAAAAIAALQEAGNKGSRDSIAASYRAYTQVGYLCIELIRQFYDERRSFRITGADGAMQFVEYSNAGIQPQALPPAYEGQEQEAGYAPGYRRPVFDIKIKAAKRSPFSRMSQNQLASDLYGAGFFDPARAEQALGALELMEFEGKDKVLQRIQQGQTLLNIVQQQAAEMEKMAIIIQQLTGRDLTGATHAAGQGTGQGGQGSGGGGGRLARAETDAANANMTGYGERLAARSVPDMTRGAPE